MAARAESARRPGRPGADTPAVPEEESVLRGGLEAFAELGYDRASARELARRLGVSHNFVNDRYGSKAAFWRAVVDSAMGAQLALLPEPDPAADDAENLRRLITGFYRVAADTPLVARLFVDELNQDTERLDYLYDNYIGVVVRNMASCVDGLVAAGRMAPIPMDVLFFAVVPTVSGMLDVPLARRLGRTDASSPERVAATAESLASLVLDGLLGAGRGSGGS
ncbi:MULTISPECIES: TetR/AcrR family transcriptional regulator [Streptomyces]|uniref:TetR/AcrR family transcriptional regulator n=1 Tax=Streptomyces griseiscabiei TaxID=2993540 RepID=A0ABU4KYQ8_9ACTN|nr:MULTISPECIES: TetR/AcrR family transcriptional regulator [Streptomyces]MBZ3904788.1 TetR family transcriptional regulator [Streptomyces griseiscabiei]MDX2908541.1 TetR/AcrR family transcriptional regulator [Streptomyces griseiscabiei]